MIWFCSSFPALAGEFLRSSSVARALDVNVIMTSLPHLKNLVLQLSLRNACKVAALQRLLMSMSIYGSDITAAPEKFGFADLAGEFLPRGSVAPEYLPLQLLLPVWELL